MKKKYRINGITLVFWKESGTVWCKADGVVYCCTSDELPQTKEQAVKMAETAWAW